MAFTVACRRNSTAESSAVEDMDMDDEDALLRLALALSLQEAKVAEATKPYDAESGAQCGEEQAASSAEKDAKAVRYTKNSGLPQRMLA